ncbi:MAG: NAD(P)/FAD-dependent oxidoreductase [Gemmatales bacterium]|nr:NAD(P)/FAD-dependent oxidoreductase [Gemmatales bacterium]MDW8388353.1 FAD/NAD(P)-binding oxidoreductase [Gemmatales bacterium]
MTTALRHQIVIVGGGTAGITVAARLRRAEANLDLAIIEPSDKHYYQPLWTLVGGGVFPKETSVRPESDYIPDKATWIRSSVATFEPSNNVVVLSDGRRIGYDWLVVAAGIRIEWDKIAGLPEALGKGGVCSNYSYQHVDYTWECIRNFRGGQALFTMPNTAVKCGGAPQKIMYLAADYFRRHGVLAQSRIIYATAGAKIFAIPKYAATLEKVVARYGIETRFRHNLVAIRPGSREAVFEHLDSKETIVLRYDMIHVTPPMGPPECVKDSPLADAHGWCDVDKFTLQHVRYPNVFALGDNANLPTSKTGAAIRKQAPVLVANLLSAMKGEPLTARYDGYTSCPIVTAYGRLVLAEFDYDHQPRESFPFDQSKERYSMWLLKKYGLPWMYWHGMLRGRM